MYYFDRFNKNRLTAKADKISIETIKNKKPWPIISH